MKPPKDQDIDAAADRRDYLTTVMIVAALASHSAGGREEIIDTLTGYLWDEEEASILKGISQGIKE